MDNNGLSAADYAALSNSNGFGGGFEGLIYLAIIAFMFGGGNFGFGGNGATSAEVQRGFDNQNLENQTRDILNAVTTGTAQTVAATNQTFHDTWQSMQGLYNELQRDASANALGIANLQASQNECCNATQKLLMQNNYDAAMRDAATNANFSAQIQSVKDMIAQDKISALQAQVSQLQLAQATAGVLRFPNQWSYGAGPFPPIFGGCPNANI